MEAKGVVYSRGGHVPGDAVDHVVENMRTLRRYPDAAEAARYSEQLAHRLKQIEAQQQYETRLESEKARPPAREKNGYNIE